MKSKSLSAQYSASFRISFILMLLFAFVAPDMSAQSPVMPQNETEAEKLYKRNIKKRRINGTFIPANIEEALKEIKELTPQESLASFASADETMVVKKLHFGIGRWIRYNWNFYEGSRLSHFIKEETGISHPDDMSTYLLTLLHRELNNTPAQGKELAETLIKKRAAKRQPSRD